MSDTTKFVCGVLGKTEIEGNNLVITVNIEALCRTAKEVVFGTNESIPNSYEFAKAVAKHLTEEDEDGTTPLHLLIEEAANHLLENGETSINYEDYEDEEFSDD